MKTIDNVNNSRPIYQNNFGFLRLVFAGLVIVSHSPEILDGSRQREPLTQVFGSLSFGDVAVDIFFVISGFLITSSIMSSASFGQYFLKRIFRIYPGFVASYAFCVFVISPIVGGNLLSLGAYDWMVVVLRILFLEPPEISGSFSGLHYPALNGAMWTIGYEFRCYIAVALAAAIGLLRRRKIFVLIVAALLFARALSSIVDISNVFELLSKIPQSWIVFKNPAETLRFSGIFGVGVAFRLYRDEIVLKDSTAAICTLLVLLFMFIPPVAEFGVATFGAYIIFWFALRVRSTAISAINARNDISYGVYLYGWPIGSLLAYFGQFSPITLMIVTGILCVGAGWASWIWVEKPALDFLRQRSLRGGQPPDNGRTRPE